MESFLASHVYVALILFGFLEAACIPISSEITFGFAGVLAYQGHISLASVIIIGSLAELAGSYASYFVGRLGGRPLVHKLGRYVLVTESDVNRAERFLEGRGAWAIPVGRMLPFVRAFTSIVAGLVRLPAGRFGVLSLIGTVIYASALASIGYEVGSAWKSVSKGLSVVGYVLFALIVIAIVGFVVYRLRQFRREDRLRRSGGAVPGPGLAGSGVPGSGVAGSGVPDPGMSRFWRRRFWSPVPGPGGPGSGRRFRSGLRGWSRRRPRRGAARQASLTPGELGRLSASPAHARLVRQPERRVRSPTSSCPAPSAGRKRQSRAGAPQPVAVRRRRTSRPGPSPRPSRAGPRSRTTSVSGDRCGARDVVAFGQDAGQEAAVAGDRLGHGHPGSIPGGALCRSAVGLPERGPAACHACRQSSEHLPVSGVDPPRVRP